MSKRIITAMLLVTLLSIAPVAAAAPTERMVDDHGLVGLVQGLWEDLAHFLGIGPEPEPVEREGSDAPRSRSGRDSIGPTIDP